MRPVVESFLKNLVNNNELCMRVPDNPDIIKNIMDEHFKNQFETRTSNGLFNLRSRKNLSSSLFGIPKKVMDNMLGSNYEGGYKFSLTDLSYILQFLIKISQKFELKFFVVRQKT